MKENSLGLLPVLPVLENRGETKSGSETLGGLRDIIQGHELKTQE
jgi:hypothetical protein